MDCRKFILLSDVANIRHVMFYSQDVVLSVMFISVSFQWVHFM